MILTAKEKAEWLRVVREKPLDADPWFRARLVEILQAYFQQEDDKENGRGGRRPLSMPEKRRRIYTLKYHADLVRAEMASGKSLSDAVKAVAKQEEISPSALKKDLPKLKRLLLSL